MSIQPEGEELRKAVKWVSERREYDPGKKVTEIIQKACLKFNLSPIDAEFLSRFVIKGE